MKVKAFTKDTHGRNHYFYKPKEHKVPKASIERRGTRSGMRQENKEVIQQALNSEVDSALWRTDGEIKVNHYIKIDIPEPPEGATHFNQGFALPFEKREKNEVFIWDTRTGEWHKLRHPKIGRGNSMPIKRTEE